MKQSHIILSTALLMLTVSIAKAESTGLYISGQLGGSIIQARDINKEWSAPINDKTHLNSTQETIFSGGMSAGYNFKQNLDIPIRTEISVFFRSNAKSDTDKKTQYRMFQKTKVRMNTIMLNGYYDIYTNSAFTPYLSAGIGIATNKYQSTMAASGLADEATLSKNKTNFAWSIGTGFNYTVTENIDLGLLVRYIDGGKVTASMSNSLYHTTASAKLSAIDMMAGISYSF